MVNPLAKHVPVVLTALSVHPVVRILQLLVLLEPIPVVQHRVIHVVLANTTTKQVKQAVKHVLMANSIVKPANHRRSRVLQCRHVPMTSSSFQFVDVMMKSVMLQTPIVTPKQTGASQPHRVQI